MWQSCAMAFDPTVSGTYADWAGAIFTTVSVALGVGYYVIDRRREKRAGAGSVVAWLHPHEHGPPKINILNLSDKPIFEYGCQITAKPKRHIVKNAKRGWKTAQRSWPEGDKFDFNQQRILIDFHKNKVYLGVGESAEHQPELEYHEAVYDFYIFFRDASGRYWVRDIDRQKLVGWLKKRRLGKIGSDSDRSRTR